MRNGASWGHDERRGAAREEAHEKHFATVGDIIEMMTHFVTEMRRSVESEAQPQRLEVNDRVNYAVSCCEE